MQRASSLLQHDGAQGQGRELEGGEERAAAAAAAIFAARPCHADRGRALEDRQLLDGQDVLRDPASPEHGGRRGTPKVQRC